MSVSQTMRTLKAGSNFVMSKGGHSIEQGSSRRPQKPSSCAPTDSAASPVFDPRLDHDLASAGVLDALRVHSHGICRLYEHVSIQFSRSKDEVCWLGKLLSPIDRTRLWPSADQHRSARRRHGVLIVASCT